jgi:hypothetical protein
MEMPAQFFTYENGTSQYNSSGANTTYPVASMNTSAQNGTYTKPTPQPLDPISKQLYAVHTWYFEMGGLGAPPPVLFSGLGCPPSIVITAANSTAGNPPAGPADLCSTDGVMGSSSVPGILDNQALGKLDTCSCASPYFCVAYLPW